jgi:GT2 family glycosyltransferase
MPDVDVVVGNYEGAAVLPDLLASLERQTHAPRSVIVVDAGSRDESIAIATAAGAIVITAPNRGLGFLYNRGAEAAEAGYVLLLNNDVALEPDCIELLAAALDADESRFAADPKQVGWDSKTLVHSRTTMRRGPLLHQLVPGFVVDLRAPASDVVPTVCTNGGAMMVRRDRLLELGGFDETFFLDFEDLDLGWRAWLRGWSSVHVPGAVVRHRVAAATVAAGSAVHRQRLVSSHHNLVRFALKCLPAAAAARVVVAELIRLGVHLPLVAPALAAVARELPEIIRERRATRPTQSHLSWVLAGMPEDALPGA